MLFLKEFLHPKDTINMKILLVGEYSRLHNSLQEGLRQLNHDVILISTGDYFKDYPSDIRLQRKFENGFPKKIKVALYSLFKWDITSYYIKKQFFNTVEKLKDFDVVQLINESPFGASPKDEIEMISFLKKHNKKLFLLSCGTDFMSVSHALSDANAYSILTGYKDGTVPKAHYKYILKYVSAPFKKLHEFVYKTIDGIIASDIDYHLPLLGHPKYIGLIPNPINSSKLEYIPLQIDGVITIFMGINRSNYDSKGMVFFEEAIKIIKQKYQEKIWIEVVENLPYTKYIKKYNNAHIVLDQVYAYDQGYNALEAMAKGKVVFTGAEKEFMEHYFLEENVAINTLPDVDYLVTELSRLIENPNTIIAIGKKARSFVLEYHAHDVVAKRYIETWKKSI